MAKIVVAGNAVVITSALKLEDIKTVEKYRPNELVLKGGEDGKEPIFRLGITTGTGSINTVGASFGREASDGSGLAAITMVMPDIPVSDVTEWVADKLGSAVINLNAVEGKLPDVLESIKAEKAAVMSHISVAG